MPTIKPTRAQPLFDQGRTPANLQQAGGQPATDLWGIGKKTSERLKAKLRLDPTAAPTVADFAYANIDELDLRPSARKLLATQQNQLVNALHVKPEDADAAGAKALLAQMNSAIEDAIGALARGEKPNDLAFQEITEFARGIGMLYGIYGTASAPTPAELDKARAQGMTLAEGMTAVAVRRGNDAGVVVVPVTPRNLFEPIVYSTLEGTRAHTFIGARDVKAVAGFVVEEPTEPFARLKAAETQVRDAAARVWIDDDKAGRRERFADFTHKLDHLSKVLDAANLSPHQASSARGALEALRSIHDITAKHLDV